jgi:hypothetical protein
MTEKEGEARDLLYRQAILGPGKVPMIGALSYPDEMSFLHKEVGADLYQVGNLDAGLPPIDTLDEIKKLPWAVQYVRCGNEMKTICRENEYAGECWLERDDVKPETNQKATMGGRASWHPGNRIHQKTGRSIAYFILEALKDALTMWNEAENYELKDDDWHVTAMYDKVRDGVAKLGADKGNCNKYNDKNNKDRENFSNFMCTHPLKARTEFTPRAYPDQTSIRSLMSESMLKELNPPPEVLYQPPDVFNPNLHPPKGAIDVLNIVEGGIDFTDVLFPDYTHFYPKPKFAKAPTQTPGKGHLLKTHAGFCDGSVDSWCNKAKGNDCLLYNHNDGRHGLLTNSYCGWMVMNIPDTKVRYSSRTLYNPQQLAAQ